MTTTIKISAGKLTASGQRFCVMLDDDVLIASARDPEHEAARKLLDMGITGKMLAKWADSPIVSFVMDIEQAASRSVADPPRGAMAVRNWAPFNAKDAFAGVTGNRTA